MKLSEIKTLSERNNLTAQKFPFFDLQQIKKAVNAPSSRMPEGLTREQKIEWLTKI